MPLFEEIKIDGQSLKYHVTDTIQDSHRALQRFKEGKHFTQMVAQQTGEPAPTEPPRVLERERDCYPANDLYQFQEFAGFVFELGGYGDMTLIDPYTGKRLWVGDVLEGASIYEAMRRVLNVAEALHFPSTPETPDGPALHAVQDQQ